MSEFINFSNPFFIIALIWAVLFGYRCFSFFDVKLEGKKWEWKLHQRWFNAVGAFIGWVALYYIWKTDICNFKIEHFIALIIAFLGITGHLPFASLFGKKL